MLSSGDGSKVVVARKLCGAWMGLRAEGRQSVNVETVSMCMFKLRIYYTST